MLDRFPDRTFVFAVISVLMSAAAFAYLTFGSAIEITVIDADGNPGARRVGIGESHGTWGIVFALIPVVLNFGSVLSVPPSGKTERRHKFNFIFGTVLMWLFVAVFMRELGLVYLPAATMLTSVIVLILIRDRTWGKNEPDERPRQKSTRELREEAVRRSRRSRNRVGRRPRRRSGVSR